MIQSAYEGPIVLILVENRGEAFEVEDGRNVYTIPGSGILCVGSFNHFNSGWGITRAIYADGSEIPLKTSGDFDDSRFGPLLQKWSSSESDADGNTVLLSDPELLFFVGNSDEMREHREAWSAEGPSFKRHLCEPS